MADNREFPLVSRVLFRGHDGFCTFDRNCVGMREGFGDTQLRSRRVVRGHQTDNGEHIAEVPQTRS